jgi:hypothetical protein
VRRNCRKIKRKLFNIGRTNLSTESFSETSTLKHIFPLISQTHVIMFRKYIKQLAHGNALSPAGRVEMSNEYSTLKSAPPHRPTPALRAVRRSKYSYSDIRGRSRYSLGGYRLPQRIRIEIEDAVKDEMDQFPDFLTPLRRR